MTSDVEERIHRALKSHSLEEIEFGYRLVHPTGTGTSTLRLLPVSATREGRHVVAIAEIVSQLNSGGLPSFHAIGVQRLNAMAVHGSYGSSDGKLQLAAQFSIYSDEPAAHFAAQTILNAFGGQLAIGRSTALATVSAAVLEEQRAHHAMPRQWKSPLTEEALTAARTMLQARGLAASSGPTGVWAELPLSGDCPSRSIDPNAQTALLQVNVGISHPIAGVGYLSTISLPLSAPPDSADICRRLNQLELQESDFVPRLGAWGLYGATDKPQYSCFIPCAEPDGGLHKLLIWWCVLRASWIRDRFWAANVGLQLDTPEGS